MPNPLPFIETPAPKPGVTRPVRLPLSVIDRVIDRARREGKTRTATLIELVEFGLNNG